MTIKIKITNLKMQTFSGFFIKGGSVVLALVSSVLLARLLGPEGLGLYAFCMGVIQVLVIPASLGLQQLLIREVSAGMAAGRWGAVRGLLQRATQGVFLVSSLLGGIVVALSLFVGGGKSETLLWAAALLPLLALLLINASALRGFGHVVIGQFAEMTIKPAFFLIFVGGLYLVGDFGLSASKAMALQVLATALGCSYAYFALRKIKPYEVKTVPAVYEERIWFKSTMSFLLVATLSSLNNNISVLLLGFFNMQTETGLFQVAFRGADVVLFSVVAVSGAVAPRISNLYAQGKRDDLQKLIIQSGKYITLYAIVVSFVFIVFAEPLILLVFGEKFVGSVGPFKILCVAQMLNSIFGFSGLTLNMIGREDVTLRCMLLGFLLTVTLNFILIPTYGALGAALATSSGIVSWKFLATAILDKKFSLRCGPFLAKNWFA